MSRPTKHYSPARRWARRLVWVTFAVVLFLYWRFPPERPERPVRGARDLEVQGQFRNDWRPYRPPTELHAPVAPVPADLWRVHIEIAPNDVEILRGYYWDGWRGQRQERPEVRCTVREGGQVYTNVALHLKGSAGSFRPLDDKPALTLHFSKHAPGQRFHGYHKISLNNSVQDRSFLAEAISRELFEAAGVPTPRADHATVLINGRDLGLYVLTEGWGKPFLRRYFSDVSGNLYDGGFLQEVTGDLETNSGDHPEDRSDLRRLAEAAIEPDPAARWQRLNQVLDMERFLSFVAMEVMTCHWDGYALHRNNYRLFHDASTGRMVFMPHGMDQMFGVFRSSPHSSILPAMEGLVARAVLSTPEGQRRYLERVAVLRTNVFVPERITERVRELSRRIRPTLAAYSPALAEEHDAHVEFLCERIQERARSISDQLAAPREPLQFDGSGVAPLSSWSARVTAQRRGRMQFERTERAGRRVLWIAAQQGGGVGGWRTRVLLEAGRYRFEGQVQTRGAGDAGGAVLRVSGAREVWPQASDEVWTPLSYAFTVAEPLTEVELICEFYSVRGEAWFDEASLRLVRE